MLVTRERYVIIRPPLLGMTGGGVAPPPRVEPVISGKRSAAFAMNESVFNAREQDAKPENALAFVAEKSPQ